jgi:ribonuclease HI
MELQAPAEALKHLYLEYGPIAVLVYSDSEYVVLGCNDSSRARNKNKGYWKALDKAINHHTLVEFIHVKGHNDHLYNEMADDLAGKARKEGISVNHNG